MERIAFRAIIVLSLLGVLIGGLMVYRGRGNAEISRGFHKEEMAKHQSQNLDNCLASAVRQNDPDRVNSCYQQHGPNIQMLQFFHANVNAAESEATVGLVLSSVVPPSLFALFFVIRWVLTGRWKRAQVPHKP